MNLYLFVLCAAAFAAVAGCVSLAVMGSLPLLDQVARLVTPRHRVRVWLSIACLPTAAGLLSVLVSFLPAFGVGDDHCLAHGGHHPHICPHHAAGAPAILLWVTCLLVVLRAAYLLAGLLRSARLSHRAGQSLAEVSDGYGDALVFPAAVPLALVLGVFRPRIFLSSGLLAMGREIVEPVLAHERSHARHRDFLVRVVCPLLATGHLPFVTRLLGRRLTAAQEMAADLRGAEALVGGRARMAEALVAVAKRVSVSKPLPGLAFTDGDVSSRVRALLDGRGHWRWPMRVLAGLSLSLLAALAAAHGPIHHSLETLIGALS